MRIRRLLVLLALAVAGGTVAAGAAAGVAAATESGMSGSSMVNIMPHG